MPLDTPSQAHKFMTPFWDLSRALDGGTWAMRAKGQRYLPAFPEEKAPAYQQRLKSNFLLNAYGFALSNLTGKVFSKPVIINGNMTDPVKTWAEEDIDLLGNEITQFAKQFFREVLVAGLSHIIVDFPQTGIAANLAEERAQNARPFFRMIKAEDMIAARAVMRNGVETLVHARFFERSFEPDPDDPFVDVEVVRIRSYDEETVVMEEGGEPEQRIIWRIWEQDADTGNWIPVDGGPLVGMDRIPIVTSYANRKAFMISKLPLEDLAHTNVRHWQSNSDQIRILMFSRFPMMSATGISNKEMDTMVVGPGEFFGSTMPGAKFSIVETSGAAVELGFKDLDRLEAQMQRMSMDPLLQRSGNVTATARALDSKEANSMLQAIALGVEDTLNVAFELMALWINATPGTVTINTDFGFALDKTADLDALMKLRLAGGISLESLWAELKRRTTLDELFDPKEERRRLEEEPSFMDMDDGELMNDTPTETRLLQGGSSDNAE